jgi:hypothetical protein
MSLPNEVFFPACQMLECVSNKDSLFRDYATIHAMDNQHRVHAMFITINAPFDCLNLPPSTKISDGHILFKISELLFLAVSPSCKVSSC